MDWRTPAGRTLLRFIESLPSSGRFEITLFGSAPLQLVLEPRFLSADVDFFSQDDFTEFIRQAGLGKGQRRVYLEQCAESAFVASPTWRERAYSVIVRNVTLVLPHPIDLLVSKLPRLEPKDLRAFRLVYRLTGHPTPAELTRALQRAVDLYRPSFAQEPAPADPVSNTETVWRKLYGRKIDVHRQIIAPALRQRRGAHGLDTPPHKRRLRKLSRQTDN